MKLEVVIGLETHVQLKTKTKFFCSCDNNSDNAPPNTNICPICLAHPGTLPVANKQVLAWAVKAALMLGCTINKVSQFDRKNYFYPDLPKAYQISQFGLPIGHDGRVSFYSGGDIKTVRIERLHVEEDAAKLIHPEKANYTLVDFNRGGTPLLEIVTKPDFRTPEDAKAYLKELRLMMQYLAISDADMEKGHLRCDANISLRPEGTTDLHPKTEIKNLNSFRAVERALAFEIKRQTALWQKNTPPQQLTTRGWNKNTMKTYVQREKEESHDYRYFPEPDIPPLVFVDKKHTHGATCRNMPENEINIDCLRSEIPETPSAKVKRFMDEFSFSLSDAKTLIEDTGRAGYTEHVMSELTNWLKEESDLDTRDAEVAKKIGKLVGGWLTTEVLKYLYQQKITARQLIMKPDTLAALLGSIILKRINSTTAKTVLGKMIETGKTPADILEEEKLTQVEDEAELTSIISDILSEHASIVNDYKNGKTASLQFLIGQVMRATQGRANPQTTATLIKKLLK